MWLRGSDNAITVTNGGGVPVAFSLSLKKNSPPVKAAAFAKFNPCRGSNNTTQLLHFTGGTVTAVEIDKEAAAKNPKKDATLKGFCLNSDMSVTATEHASGKGTMYLLCTVDGWSVKKAVSVNCSASYTKPKLTFKPSSITLLPGSYDKQESHIQLLPRISRIAL